MSSYLSLVRKGRIESNPRLMLYGVDGCGKSTFASGAPAPLFLDFDNRTSHIDVARVTPDSWDATTGILRELLEGKHDYRTVVIDTLDHLERHIHKFVCDKGGKSSLGDFGFGKGFVAAMAEWRRLVSALELLRAKGIDSILLAHGVIHNETTPTGEMYAKYGLKLLGTKGNSPGELLSEKMDLVGYCHFEDFVIADKATGRNKAVPGGDRIITFAHHPGFQSKRGIKFPDEIPLSWDAYTKAITASKGE